MAKKIIKAEEEKTSLFSNIAFAIVLLQIKLGIFPQPRKEESLKQFIDRLWLLPTSIKKYIEKYSLDEENTNRISALHFFNRLKNEVKKGELYGDSDLLLVNGYKQIIEHLAQHIKIELNSKVLKIDWRSDIIEIFSENKSYKNKKSDNYSSFDSFYCNICYNN